MSSVLASPAKSMPGPHYKGYLCFESIQLQVASDTAETPKRDAARSVNGRTPGLARPKTVRRLRVTLNRIPSLWKKATNFAINFATTIIDTDAKNPFVHLCYPLAIDPCHIYGNATL